MFQIIATDLDGTFLQDNAHVSKKDIESVNKAAEKGVHVVLSTGRPFNSVQGTLKEIGLDGKIGEYVISYNGGAITDNEKNELLYFNGIDYEEVVPLFEKGLAYGLPMRIYTLEGNYHYGLDEEEKAFIDGRLEVIPFDTPDLSFMKDHKIVKLNYVSTDKEKLDRIREEIKDLTKNFDITFSSGRYMEFNRKGVDKGEALKKLAQILDIPIEETIAMGDNYNDQSMLKAAGLGIGVANVVEEVRDDCDVILDASCNDNPMTEVIERFVLND